MQGLVSILLVKVYRRLYQSQAVILAAPQNSRTDTRRCAELEFSKKEKKQKTKNKADVTQVCFFFFLRDKDQVSRIILVNFLFVHLVIKCEIIQAP